MVHIPRHYKSVTKQKSNSGIFVWVVIISLVVIFIFSWKYISEFMTSDKKHKIIRFDKDVNTAILKKNLNSKLLNEYKKVSNEYVKNEPNNPSSHHHLAKAYFYELVLNNFYWDFKKTIQYISIELIPQTQMDETQNKSIEKMYRLALRASAFGNQFKEKDSNEFLICLFEVLKDNIKAEFLVEKLSLIENKNLTEYELVGYIWIGMINSIKSGNDVELDRYLELNNALNIKFISSEREVAFLKGVTLFYKKDYIKSLNYLREAETEDDWITFNSKRIEAKIFFAQNLFQKSIELLEELNERKKLETGTDDPYVLQDIQLIISKQPSVITKYKEKK